MVNSSVAGLGNIVASEPADAVSCTPLVHGSTVIAYVVKQPPGIV